MVKQREISRLGALLLTALAAVMLQACASGGGRGSKAFKVLPGEGVYNIVARLGAPEETQSDGRGGKIVSWTRTEEEFDFSSTGTGFESNPRYGSLPVSALGTSGNSMEAETVVTRFQVWVDSNGKVYDSKLSTKRGDEAEVVERQKPRKPVEEPVRKIAPVEVADEPAPPLKPARVKAPVPEPAPVPDQEPGEDGDQLAP